MQVKSLHRYEFAGLKLNNVKEGKYKLLKKNIIQSIKLKYGYEK